MKDRLPNGGPIRREPIGTKCELRVWQERYKRDGQRERVAVEGLWDGPRYDSKYAIVVSQVFTKKSVLEMTILSINSPHILKAFQVAIRSYPTIPFDFTEPFDMESPFRMLYHCWDDLANYRESLDDDEARMHLNLLFEFMEADMGFEKQRCEAQIKKGQIDFSRLWTLYRPGQLQIAVQAGHPWLLRVVKTAYEETEKEGKFLEIHCIYTDYDENRVGEAQHMIKILQKESFASENPAFIKDLPVYPRRDSNEDETLEKRLEKRGQYFLDLQGTHVRHYNGLAQCMLERPSWFYDPRMGRWSAVWDTCYENGRVVIDRTAFQQDFFREQVHIRPLEPQAVELMLCPPFAYGFSLTRMEWCKFYLPHISCIDWKTDSFDLLVMKEEQKNLLRALVVSHQFPEHPRDLMSQKGGGLVILLHGTPGSGKTLTAEFAAEITGKALVRTSMAELNKENRPWYFERQLSRVLRYATTWKAIVLLDEADVFLEARKDDIADAAERNALVAVFLKYLEYFGGIVFLTTNRIQVFDLAMWSRIHLALGFSPPEKNMRRTIWTQCLRQLPAEQLDFNIDEAAEELAKEELNGREVVNAVNTARTLARHEERPLGRSHLEKVVILRREFNVSLQRLQAIESANEQGSGSIGPLTRQMSLLGMVV